MYYKVHPGNLEIWHCVFGWGSEVLVDIADLEVISSLLKGVSPMFSSPVHY